MAISPPNDTSIISEAIKRAVQSEVESAFDIKKKELIEKLEREKDTIVSGIVLNLMEYVEYKTIDRNLVITIRKIEQ